MGADGEDREEAGLDEVETELHKLGTSGQAWGDTSRTWQWPLTGWLDRVSMAWPMATGRKFPLVARLIVDGAYLRAMVSSLSLTLPVVAAVLAGFAVEVNEGSALPPTAPLLLALLVVGVLDALSGAVAVAVYAIGVIIAGGMATPDSLRILMGIGVLWFAVPLIANAIRPLRRPISNYDGFRFDRFADFVVASLIGAWTAQNMVGAWPGLSGLELPIVSAVGLVATVTMGAILLRMLLESLAARFYPERIAAVAPLQLPECGKGQSVVSLVFRTAVFAFIVVAFLGNCWQLWVGVLLFFLPQLMWIYEEHFPNFPKVFPHVPTGIYEVVVILMVGSLVAAWLESAVPDPQQMLVWGFVLISIPGVVLSVLGLFGRDGDDPALTWKRRLIGAAIFLIGVVLVLVTG